MSVKRERLESQIVRLISSMLTVKINDSKLQNVTITACKLTNDLSIAKVYYIMYGNDDKKEAVEKSFAKVKGFIKKELAKNIKIRKMPELIFEYDTSFEYGNKIDQILESIKKEK